MKSLNLSIIIPAHNEENRIRETLEKYGEFFAVLKKEKKLDFEIVVVLNACSDNTLDIVKKVQSKYKEIKYLDFEEGGKGFAIIEGYKYALKSKANLIGFVDADMATSPQAFYDLVKNIKNYDGIIASRSRKGADVKRTAGKAIRSIGFNLYTRSLFLFPIHDTQCGAKIFRRQVIEKVINKLNITKWAFDVCLLYQVRKNKFSIKELATVWEDKEGSKIGSESFKKGLLISFQMAAAITRLRIIYSPFKHFIRLYDKLPKNMRIQNWQI